MNKQKLLWGNSGLCQTWQKVSTQKSLINCPSLKITSVLRTSKCYLVPWLWGHLLTDLFRMTKMNSPGPKYTLVCCLLITVPLGFYSQNEASTFEVSRIFFISFGKCRVNIMMAPFCSQLMYPSCQCHKYKTFFNWCFSYYIHMLLVITCFWVLNHLCMEVLLRFKC